MDIPRILHQTWKDSRVPDAFADYVASWKGNHPDWEYRLWTDEDNRQFIARYYSWFLYTYDGYPRPIQRADAIRYFILHKYGGLYVDLDFLSCTPIDPLLSGRQCVLGVEPPKHCRQFGVRELVCNALMAAVPGHPFFETVIRRLPEFVDHVQCKQPVLSSTGPLMLTHVYEDSPDKHSMDVFPSRYFYPLTLHQATEFRLTGRTHVDVSHSIAIHLYYGTWWKASWWDLPRRIGYTVATAARSCMGYARKLRSPAGNASQSTDNESAVGIHAAATKTGMTCHARSSAWHSPMAIPMSDGEQASRAANVDRILLDCTSSSRSGINTGIQRAVRNIAKEGPHVGREYGVEVQPVVLRYGRFHSVQWPAAEPMPSAGARLVGRWAAKLRPPKPGASIQFGLGDVLLSADCSWEYGFWDAARRAQLGGTQVATVIHDLIPLTHPDTVVPKYAKVFRKWVNDTLTCGDFFIAVSTTVRDQVASYARRHFPERDWDRVTFTSFHHGTVLDQRASTSNIRRELRQALTGSGPDRTTYLTVGTIEPKKNHHYLLDAFEQVWQRHPDVRLCVVGMIGWKTRDIVRRITRDPRFGRRLFMFNDLNDSELDYAYRHAKALVIPSLVEGFGLPLVEALQHRLPVLASDIPIFHEVGGDYCRYFDLSRCDSLADLVVAIQSQADLPPIRAPEEYTPQTWEQSVRVLLAKCLRACRHNLPSEQVLMRAA